MLKLKQVLTLFLISCTSLHAQLDTAYFDNLKTDKVTSSNDLNWVQFGPGMSGYCEFFWPHPTDPNTIHMAPDMFNAYGTFDAGQTWQSIKDYDGLGRDMGRTYDIEFSRQNPNLGFATDELGGLFKTTNRGRSWTKQSFHLGAAHSEIAVDPKNDDRWYIGAGSWWDVKRTHRTATDIYGEMRPTAIRGHIYRTEDGGSSWLKVPAEESSRRASGLPAELDVIKIEVNPLKSWEIIMAANTGMYKSTNKGKNWYKIADFNYPGTTDAILPKAMSSTFINGNFTLFVIAQTRYYKNGTTYSSDGGIFKSTDAGITWTSITGDLGIDLSAISEESKYLFKRTMSNWLGITNGQVGNKDPGNLLQTFNRIVVNPNNTNEIFISHNVKHDYSFGPGDVWKTTNGGLNWYPCTLTGKYWGKDQNYWTVNKKMPISLFKKNTTFAHIQHNMDIREEVWGCRFLSINSNGDLFISLDQQVLKSTNGGATWSQIDDNETSTGSKAWIGRGGSNLPGRYIHLETGINGRKFFLSGEHGLWQSTDLGNFSKTNLVATEQIEGQVNPKGAHSTAVLAVHPNNPNTLYTLQFRQKHRDNFRVSYDAGATWQNIGTPINHDDDKLSSEHMKSASLLIDYNNPNNIYFTLMRFSPSEVNDGDAIADFDDYGVYKSIDGGVNWTFTNKDFPKNATIRRLAMDPNDPTILYAASNLNKEAKGGLYKSIDGADSWSLVPFIQNDMKSIRSVNDVHVVEKTGDIYISCGTSWANPKEGGVWKSTDNGTTWEKIFDAQYVWQTTVSTLDPNIIAVTVPRSNSHMNPGAYVTFDGGSSWTKVNKNLAHPHAITDIKPDNQDRRVFWSAGWGSGWYKGIWQGELPASSVESKPFYIVNRKTGKKIRSKDASINGAPLEQVPSSWSGEPTKWVKVYSNNNYFYLKNLETGMYFRPEEDGNVNGSTIVQRPDSFTGYYTQWKEQVTSDGYFYLINRQTQMYFRPVNDDDYSNYTQRPTTYSGNYTQWKFIDVDNGLNPITLSNPSDQILISPNPTNQNFFDIDTSSKEPFQVTLYNFQGKLIFTHQYKNQKARVPLNNIQKGFYIVIITNGKNREIKKLLVN